MTTISIEDILAGTGLGSTQSVAQMQVIPLLGDDDATFAPPIVEVGTQAYGTVVLRADSDTLVPTGAGWVVRQRAQDHALPSATFLRKGEQKVIKTAMCIQQSQGGTIEAGAHALTILPAALRKTALAVRHVEDFRKLWESIGALTAAEGVPHAGASLAVFLAAFERELDAFVAELELVDRQIGVIVLVAGEVVGVERAPSHAYFAAVWEPLVRVCYGSLAVAAARANKAPPATRVPLFVVEKTLDGLSAALAIAEEREAVIAQRAVAALATERLEPTLDETFGDAALYTVANGRLAGQCVMTRGAIQYASLTA